ncbi:MAG: hypothetical protein FWE13_04920 [Firmicutes bacterium]|nr:hypothetical protein [Bacillota bacterium]
MSTNLKALLDYQTVDVALRRASNELEKHPDREKLAKTKTDFEKAKQAVADAEWEATKYVEFFDEAKKEVPPLIKLAGELTEKLDKIPENDEESRRALTKELEDVKEKLNRFENRMADRKGKGQKAIVKFKEAQEAGKKLRELYAKQKERYDVFQKDAEPKIVMAKKKLETLKKGVDAKLLEKYLILAGEGKIPSLVEVKVMDGGKTYNCFCGLALSQASKAQVIENGFSNCDNCRRMIYLNK